MDIVAAHLNTSRATEMLFTKMDLAVIGHQDVVHHVVHWKTPSGEEESSTEWAGSVLLTTCESVCVACQGFIILAL